MTVDKRPKGGLDLAVMLLLDFQAQIKVARAILEEVAAGDVYYTEQPDGWNCLYCDGFIFGESTHNETTARQRFTHNADCPVTQARTWLAENPA